MGAGSPSGNWRARWVRAERLSPDALLPGEDEDFRARIVLIADQEARVGGH